MLQEIANILRGVLSIFRKRRPLRHKDTGIGTDFLVLAPGFPFKLLEIRFKTAALAAGETLTFNRVNRFPATGAQTYLDYLIYSRDLGTGAITNVSVAFDSDEGIFDADDTIVPALSANAGGDRWGLEIVYEPI